MIYIVEQQTLKMFRGYVGDIFASHSTLKAGHPTDLEKLTFSIRVFGRGSNKSCECCVQSIVVQFQVVRSVYTLRKIIIYRPNG